MIRHIIKRSFPLLLLAILIPLLLFTSPILNEVKSTSVLSVIYFSVTLNSLLLIGISMFEYLVHCFKYTADLYAQAYDDNTEFVIKHSIIPKAFKYQFRDFNDTNILKVVKTLKEKFPQVF